MIYLNFVPITEIGVRKKIQFQIKALKNNGGSIQEWSPNKNNKFCIEEKEIFNYLKGNKLSQKLKEKISQMIIFLSLKKKSYYDEKKIIYIRYFYTYPWSLSYFKFLKKLNLKVIVEIPTYPYDNEIKKQNIFTKMDKYYRTKLYKYVDRLVTYSEHKEIWGIPCINISNGIDLDEIQLVNKKEKGSNEIVFTIVSNCSFWHGIDRILNSLEKYGEQKNKKDVLLNIVGEGNELDRLKKLVVDSKYLSKIVKFQGFKMGRELDDIYDNTDIGVGSLGIHRIGLKEVQPLKNREYTAKGIPFVISFVDPEFKEKDYVYKIESSEEIFDVEKLINWYESNKFTPSIIREDAKRFTWDIQMKKVLDSI